MQVTAGLPLEGVRVVELVHMVMGPSCGMVLADLGADVIKVEPPGGDNTRRLTGSGAGFFATFNRNKRSLALDVREPRGRDALERLVAGADVLTENFRPGAMARLDLGPEAVRARHPHLVYCSLKGFLAGPYAHRTALDEVVQMMGGLAYMTGPPGRPLRAGSSVNDIMGGMFAAIAILAALRERDRTGEGQHVESALFENNALLVAQHMAQFAVTGKPAPPMPQRLSAWAIYDVFDTADGDQVFVGVVTDTQWARFCEAFERPDLLADPSLGSNPARVAERPRLLPLVAEIFARLDKAELMARCEAIGLPYAPITRPEDLLEDPHLLASGGLVDLDLPDGRSTRLPALPVALRGRRPGLRRALPRVGEHTREVLAEVGLSSSEIDALVADGIAGDDRGE
ncbi:MAG: CoA transferase [Ectothiorhodospiraceae bacterium]|nr:CoA transferase [Chromatiales bacterium]MCP5157253.1 CoA transferase [Ectothiorhodospiraceae bacterium]